MANPSPCSCGEPSILFCVISISSCVLAILNVCNVFQRYFSFSLNESLHFRPRCGAYGMRGGGYIISELNDFKKRKHRHRIPLICCQLHNAVYEQVFCVCCCQCTIVRMFLLLDRCISFCVVCFIHFFQSLGASIRCYFTLSLIAFFAQPGLDYVRTTCCIFTDTTHITCTWFLGVAHN